MEHSSLKGLRSQIFGRLVRGWGSPAVFQDVFYVFLGPPLRSGGPEEGRSGALLQKPGLWAGSGVGGGTLNFSFDLTYRSGRSPELITVDLCSSFQAGPFVTAQLWPEADPNSTKAKIYICFVGP